jgi:hypothetical protein
MAISDLSPRCNKTPLAQSVFDEVGGVMLHSGGARLEISANDRVPHLASRSAYE